MSWNLERPSNLNFEGTVMQHVVQAAYFNLSRRGKMPTWRRIVNWTDLYYRRASLDSAIPQPEQYKSAVSLLNTLHGWYHNQFIPRVRGKDIEPLINVPVCLELGHDVAYRDVVPLVIIRDDVRLVDFRQLDKTRKLGMIDVYNDLLVHVRIWGFQQAAQQVPSSYIRFFITPESIKPVEMKITKEMLANAAVISKHILTGIKDRVFYPSFSEQCVKCPFRRNCLI
jgi:hypothetical protein